MTPEQRRQAVIDHWVNEFDYFGSPVDISSPEAADLYDSLLEYFDRNEPEVADTIRYGLRRVLIDMYASSISDAAINVRMEVIRYSNGEYLSDSEDAILYEIDSTN